MKKFQAIEGNAGDLYLFVFDENGKVVWGYEGYEYFVHVQLKSGVCESVLWADLINASEENK